MLVLVGVCHLLGLGGGRGLLGSFWLSGWVGPLRNLSIGPEVTFLVFLAFLEVPTELVVCVLLLENMFWCGSFGPWFLWVELLCVVW